MNRHIINQGNPIVAIGGANGLDEDELVEVVYVAHQPDGDRRDGETERAQPAGVVAVADKGDDGLDQAAGDRTNLG